MLMHKTTSMMHARPIRPHKIAILKMAITFLISVAYHVLFLYIARRRLHSIYAFVVRVPAENSHFSPTPHIYMKSKYFTVYTSYIVI